MVQGAFNMKLHVIEQNGVRFYRNSAVPVFAGAHAELIGGIAGARGARGPIQS